MNNLIFFINGTLDIDKLENSAYDHEQFTYKMRFLAESDKEIKIKLVLCDDATIGNGNEISYFYTINRLTSIVADCTDFMEKYNYGFNIYKRIKYYVYVLPVILDKIYIYDGSFPLINPSHNSNLNIGIIGSLYKINTWEQISEQQYDIVVHMGDEINSELIIKQKLNKKMIYSHYANLYRQSYSDEFKGISMRNCLNIFLANYDVCNINLAKKLLIPNEYYHYYKTGMKAFLKYQFQLMYNIEQSYNVTKYDSIMRYNLKYGKYVFALFDFKQELYLTNEFLGSDAMNNFKNNIDDIDNKEILMFTNIPLKNSTFIKYNKYMNKNYYKNIIGLLDYLCIKNNNKYSIISLDDHILNGIINKENFNVTYHTISNNIKFAFPVFESITMTLMKFMRNKLGKYTFIDNDIQSDHFTILN